MDDIKLRKIYDSIGLMQKNLECSICLELLQDPVSTKCDHQFCNFCVLALLQSSRKPSAPCPLCKTGITKRSLTKNEPLDKIVRAVRSVINAVEEDTGLRCSPPRGPVLISQPDPKPRRPSPEKQVRGQRSAKGGKVKGRQKAGNVRKTKRKSGGAVDVFQDESDSSDSDVAELAIVGHTNISSSFPRLNVSKKKGGDADENDDRDMEMEAEELLNALNAAPLSSNHSLIPHYSSPLAEGNQQNKAQSPKRNCTANNKGIPSKGPGKSHPHSSPSLLEDTSVFEVPALPKRTGKENILADGEVDPYEFVPSQRTPKKGKKKGVANKRKRNPKAKTFPIRNKGVALSGKPNAKGDGSLNCMSTNQNKQEDSNENDTSKKDVNTSTTENANGETSTSKKIVDKSNIETSSKPVEEEDKEGFGDDDIVLDANIEDIGDGGTGKPKRKSKRVEKVKNPLPLAPVVAKRTTRATACPPATQSSDSQMMPDSQPLQINRNHGRRVFATVYGKPKNGLDKSPPLDPQERVLDWLVSKTPGDMDSDAESDEGRGDGGQSEEEDDMDELPEIFQLTPSLQELPEEDQNGPLVEDNMDIPQQHEEQELEKEINKPLVLNDEKTLTKSIQDTDDQGHTNTCPDENESKESSTHGMKRKQRLPESTVTESTNALDTKKDVASDSVNDSTTQESAVPRRQSGRQSKANAIKGNIQESVEIVEDTMQSLSEEKKTPPKRRTAKQRMAESFKEEMVAAQKEAEAAAIKSDWELALELAMQFGTAPDHLASTSEDNKRSSRRRKGKLSMETVPEQKPVRKTRRSKQELPDEDERGSTPIDNTITIDSFETQDVRKALANEITCKPQNRGKAKTKNKHCEKEEPSVVDHPAVSEIRSKGIKQIKPKGSEHTEAKTNIACSADKVLHIPETLSLTGSQEQVQFEKCQDEDKDVADKNEVAPPDIRASQCKNKDGKDERRPSTPVVQSGTPGSKVRRSKRLTPASTSSDAVKHVNLELGKDDQKPKYENEKLLVKHVDHEEDDQEIPTSLPLYTEDITKDGCHPAETCKGSDTTESIHLEVTSDDYEEPMEITQSKASQSELEMMVDVLKTRRCSISLEKQDIVHTLDDEMDILDSILPSGDLPSSGLSHNTPPGTAGTDGNDADNVDSGDDTEIDLVESKSKFASRTTDDNKEMHTVRDSGNKPNACKTASQSSSPIVVSQVKTAESLLAFASNSCSQPSESLLQPMKKSKRNSPSNEQAAKKAHKSQERSSPKLSIDAPCETRSTSGQDKQQVDSSVSFAGNTDVQGVVPSSGQSEGKPSAQLSRKKRKTFTLGVTKIAASASKESASPDDIKSTSEERLSKDQVKLNGDVNTNVIKDSQEQSTFPSPQDSVIEIHSEPRRTLRSRSRASQERMPKENVDHSTKISEGLECHNIKRARSLPTSNQEQSKKIDKEAGAGKVNISQENSSSSSTRTTLRSRRKSRSSSRQNTQSPAVRRDQEESTAKHDTTKPRVSSPASQKGKRKSSTGKEAYPTAGCSNEVANSSVVPTTPGASEMVDQSSAVIGLGPLPLGLSSLAKEKKNRIDDSSSRVLRRSSRNSRPGTQTEEVDQKKSVDGETGKCRVSDGSSVQQENVVVVEERVPVSGVEEESQESNLSIVSVRDIFYHPEDSRDMFDDDDADVAENSSEVMLLEVEPSQASVVHESITTLQDDILLDPSSSGPLVDDQIATDPKPELVNQFPFSTLSASASNNIEISQKSCKDDYTEALIPPTPPCENKSYMAIAAPSAESLGGTKGTRRSGRRSKPNEIATSSLFSHRRASSVGDHSTLHGKSLVLETPAVPFKTKARRSNDAEDTVVADTPTCQRQAHEIPHQDEHQSDEIAEEQSVTELCFDGEDTSALGGPIGKFPSVAVGSGSSSKKSNHSLDVADAGYEVRDPDDLPTSKTMTSQVIEDTPVETTVPKSSNESDEVVRRGRKRRKPAIEDIESDQECEVDDDDVIGRQKPKKAHRMVAVGVEEEEESDDELIPCSFLQSSVKEQEEAVEGPATGHIEEDGDSISSQESMASHHMTLTSASSILSSQSEIMSEIMNTQQRENAQEKMEHLEKEMAELQAALAGHNGSKIQEDSSDEKTGEERDSKSDGDEEEDEGKDVAIVQQSLSPAPAGSPRSSRKSSKALARSSRIPKVQESRKSSLNGNRGAEEGVSETDDDERVEPRSPSPPPPMSPDALRKASKASSLSTSIHKVTRLVEQYRSTSCKKGVSKKRMPEGNDGRVSSDEDTDCQVLSGSRLNGSSSARKNEQSQQKHAKKRMMIRDGDSDSEDGLSPAPRSNSNSQGKRIKLGDAVPSSRATPKSRTTPVSRKQSVANSNEQLPSSSRSDARHTQQPRTPTGKFARTPRNQAREGASSSLPSPVDVSMRTQQSVNERPSPAGGSRDSSRSSQGRRSSGGSGSRTMSLIATGLNRIELRQVEQLTSHLATCRFASAFNANTTHVIVKTDASLVCERTLKYFQGISARAWIVSYQWIVDSLRAGRLLPEERYEVRGDVVNGASHRGPTRARTWQGPGFLSTFDLCCIGPFTGLNKDQLVGLCEMCGASTVQHPSLFPYTRGRRAFIVVEPNTEDTDRDYHGLHRKFRVPVISREWILDSVAHYKTQPISDYLLSKDTSLNGNQPIIDLDSDDDDADSVKI